MNRPRAASRGKPDSGGFALVLTLFLLVLLSFSVLEITRRSLTRALEVREQEEALLRHWALRSLRETLTRTAPTRILARADKTFKEASERLSDQQRFRLRSISGRLALTGIEIDYHVSLEDAKVDLNALYRRGGLEAIDEGLRLLDETFEKKPTRRPYAPTDNVPATDPFSSYEQLFSLGGAQIRQFFRNPGASPLERITLFSAGKLHYQLAREEDLRAFLADYVPDETIDEVLEWRRLRPEKKTADLLTSLPLEPTQRERLRLTLDDTGSAYSYWFDLRQGKRRESFLFVERTQSRPGAYVLRLWW